MTTSFEVMKVFFFLFGIFKFGETVFYSKSNESWLQPTHTFKHDERSLSEIELWKFDQGLNLKKQPFPPALAAICMTPDERGNQGRCARVRACECEFC